MIAVIYRFGPSRDQPQWRWISPGSVFAARDLDRGFATFFLVHVPLRKLQQDLRVARRRGRLHDLDLDIHDGHSDRRQAQCGARTSNRRRHHGGLAGTARRARCPDGRHRRAQHLTWTVQRSTCRLRRSTLGVGRRHRPAWTEDANGRPPTEAAFSKSVAAGAVQPSSCACRPSQEPASGKPAFSRSGPFESGVERGNSGQRLESK